MEREVSHQRPAGLSIRERQILIGHHVLLWSHPSRCFSLPGSTALFILDCSAIRRRSKGLRMCRMLWGGREERWFFFWPWGQRAWGLMRKEHKVMCCWLFTQSYSSELNFNPTFKFLCILTNAVHPLSEELFQKRSLRLSLCMVNKHEMFLPLGYI